MNRPVQFWWVRHAPIAQNGCYIGQSDVAALLPQDRLSLDLPKQALWFSSPLRRAVETARWLDAPQPQLEPALMEQHFGEWEGKSYTEVWREAEHAHAWSRPETVKPPGGESFVDVCARVEAWVQNISSSHAGQSLVIVSHAGPIRAALRHALKISYAEALAQMLDYASVTHIVGDRISGQQ